MNENIVMLRLMRRYRFFVFRYNRSRSNINIDLFLITKRKQVEMRAGYTYPLEKSKLSLKCNKNKLLRTILNNINVSILNKIYSTLLICIKKVCFLLWLNQVKNLAKFDTNCLCRADTCDDLVTVRQKRIDINKFYEKINLTIE
jgi:hypothetical protein